MGAIRPYDPVCDTAALRACLVEHQGFHRALEPSWPEGAAVVDDYVAYLAAQCARHGGRIMLAEHEREIVGFVCVVASLRNDSPDDPATFAWIYDLFVKAAFRRRGIGTALMAAAEAFVRAGGAKELRLGVLDRNADARALYQARGFRDYTRVLTTGL